MTFGVFVNFARYNATISSFNKDIVLIDTAILINYSKQLNLLRFTPKIESRGLSVCMWNISVTLKFSE